jgi:hypothetical protein
MGIVICSRFLLKDMHKRPVGNSVSNGRAKRELLHEYKEDGGISYGIRKWHICVMI